MSGIPLTACELHRIIAELDQQHRAIAQMPSPLMPSRASEDGLAFQPDLASADLPVLTSAVAVRPASGAPARRMSIATGLVGLSTAVAPMLTALASAAVGLWAAASTAVRQWWAAPSRAAAARTTELVALKADASTWARWSEENGMLTAASVWRDIAAEDETASP